MKKIKLSNEVLKFIKSKEYYTEDDFIKDAKTYVKAVKSGRILYTVTHVSSSGMSRDINIKSFEGNMANGSYRSYNYFLQAMGYKFKKHSWDITVSGCGMNMLFGTNYNIIHDLTRMNIINDSDCKILAQKVN
jgi:hypothetical protein